MASVINTNIMSLNAQRNLSNTQTALGTAMQRLSSGLRINSAKDDAAGLAISERFTTQIRGLNMAIRNANDGISLSQTAEGALGSVASNLQRIRELAVQSANSTNSASDRAALDQEVQQLKEEIDRVARQTSFNGLKILDGSFGDAVFQVGPNAGDTIGINLETSMRLSALGNLATATSAQLASIFGNSSDVSGAYTNAVSQAAAASAAGQGWSLSVDGIDIYSEQQTTVAGDGTNAYTAVDTSDAAGEVFALTLTSGTQTIDAFRFTSTAAGENVTAANIQAALDANLADIEAAGYTVSGTVAGNNLQFVRADGATFQVNVANDYGDSPTGGFADYATGATNSVTGAQITVTAAEIDAALAAKAPELEAAGISFTGTAAAGTLEFVRADGRAFDISLVNDLTTAGSFAGGDAFGSGANLTNGTVTIDNGTPVSLAAGDLDIRLGDSDAPTYSVTGTFNNLQELADSINSKVPGVTALVNSSGRLEFTATETITISGAETGAGGNVEFQDLVVETSGDGLTEVNVRTVDDANDAILRMDAALTAVNNLRAEFGAIQNRFDSTIQNLTVTAENLTASRSRIMDADFAQETASLSRAQILQQAGTAMVAQANQMPQGVLALLR